jgi:hypothetical protein
MDFPRRIGMKQVMKTVLFAALITAFVATAGVVYAQKKHPNLAAAKVDLDHAFDKLVAAQQANEWDLGGHAQKAKDLIDQARKETNQAVNAANK